MRAIFAVAIIIASLLALQAHAATRPVIPEQFTAGTDSHIRTPREVVSARGVWVVDRTAGKAFEFQKVNVPHRHEFDFERVDRFDLKKSFEVFDNKTCHIRQEEGHQPDYWEWVKNSTYDGSRTIEGQTYDLWAFRMGHAHVFLAVKPTEPNVPVYFMSEGPERNLSTHYISWHVGTPNEAYFNVPAQCSHNQEVEAEAESPVVGCVGRSTMISRAQDWVTHHVPYNQGGSYGGYRTDCSGYVSMAWEAAKPGYTTQTLPHISHPISKASLQPGDVLLCTSEHVVIFGGWSGGQTHFVAYEETRPGEGTVKRVTPYPYWYNTGCFKPYRFNQVC